MTSYVSTRNYTESINWSDSFGFYISAGTSKLLNKTLENWRSSIRANRTKMSKETLRQLAAKLRTSVLEVEEVLQSYL